MGSTLIGRIPATYISGKGLIVDPADQFLEQQLQQALDDISHGKPMPLRITVERQTNLRTLAQNRMMWELLTIMADDINAGRPGGVSPERCYVDMLEAYGVSSDRLEVPIGALDILRSCYRVVHTIELLDGNRCIVACGEGSSKFSTQQMRGFIDCLFDRLAEMGVNSPIVTEYWQRWQEDRIPRRGVHSGQEVRGV